CRTDKAPVLNTQSATTQPHSVRVQAAFCQYDTVMTSASGSVDSVSSPRDPGFQSLMATVATTLFPYDREDRRERCPGSGMC
ncbi:MAG: hypothetical protein M3O22_08315, partial [Pseudomonadota bacterium]|nr:hypothetical protein [Pseudomonadota bacterium]